MIVEKFYGTTEFRVSKNYRDPKLVQIENVNSKRFQAWIDDSMDHSPGGEARRDIEPPAMPNVGQTLPKTTHITEQRRTMGGCRCMMYL
jgi:hypothetical protein